MDKVNLKRKFSFFSGLFLLVAVSGVFFAPVYGADKESHDSAQYYEKGKALYDKKQYKEAYPYLLKAAEMGNAKAQMHLGKMFYNGWGVPHNHAKGKAWHEKAAAQGNAESIKKLEQMRKKGGDAHH